MYDILILDARKTKEKYKYSPNNVHFIVHRPPQCHKNYAAETFYATNFFARLPYLFLRFLSRTRVFRLTSSRLLS